MDRIEEIIPRFANLFIPGYLSLSCFNWIL
jgi:hypothetical protein